MEKLCFIILLITLLSACNLQDGDTEISESAPSLNIEVSESPEELERITGVVCWDNCSNEDLGFGFSNIDKDKMPTNIIKEDALFLITHEGTEADRYGYFAITDKGVGYNTFIEDNTFTPYKQETKYLVIAQWLDNSRQLKGYTYAMFEVETQ
ncbi:hypothetical protein [Alteribacter natronophilus]|uniref:hypothetical protein n=1 Tax=Alteribacter natronophilus TaxID=2583810 RepID=UPI00110E2CA4|nr:hypothetical protein [Alteribacter natronophilus]TMW72834.1 hypothetical protein FGB90_00535 [Alteribacter natronophilus]